jgi:nicotinamidase-related amidase
MNDQVENPFLHKLPIPPHFNQENVGDIWKVPYQSRAAEARMWARQHNLPPAYTDAYKICLIAIDVQNTFCIPGFELFVGGRSGMGAVEDNRRLCEFLYRNLGVITQVAATLDTHQAMQIFHAIFLVDPQGNHPEPMTLVSHADILQERWKFNPPIADNLDIDPSYGQEHLLHYTKELKDHQKYDLTIWPYHAMLGSIGHALVAAFEEAVFFHTIARYSQADFDVKGRNSLTEHYSALGPEVLRGPAGEEIAQKSYKFIQKLTEFDAVIIAGQAKSHCVAWTIADLLGDILAYDESLVEKVYLLEDCTSPVVAPGLVDYTDQAEAAFERFAQAGMHIVRSTDSMVDWPGLKLPEA